MSDGSPIKIDQSGWSYSCLKCLCDEDLMEKVAQGHHDALAVLFERYYRLVLGIATPILRDPVQAEDVLQSVFLEILQVAGLFDRTKGKVKPWLLRYAYHRSLDRRRQQIRIRSSHVAIDDDSVHWELAAKSSGIPQRCCNSHELSRALEEGLTAISEEQRQTLYLAFVEGLNLREIADHLGVTFANVRHHYYRGLQRLRRFLGGQVASQVEHSSEKVPYVES